MVSIFGRQRDQRASQQSPALSQIAFEHLEIVFDKSNNLHSKIQFVKQHAYEMCKNVILATLKYNCGGGNKYWERHVEIQKLILIDFTGLNGGIKKGSIDAILLSIEMIEQGFVPIGFPARKLTQGFCFRGFLMVY